MGEHPDDAEAEADTGKPRRESATSKSSDPQPPKTAPRVVSPYKPAERPEHRWTFLTNHAHVLILLHANPQLVLREVAPMVGITERAVQRIVQDLEEGGFIRRERVGRRNHYFLNTEHPLRHPIEAHRTIGDLLTLLTPPAVEDGSEEG